MYLNSQLNSIQKNVRFFSHISYWAPVLVKNLSLSSCTSKLLIETCFRRCYSSFSCLELRSYRTIFPSLSTHYGSFIRLVHQQAFEEVKEEKDGKEHRNEPKTDFLERTISGSSTNIYTSSQGKHFDQVNHNHANNSDNNHYTPKDCYEKEENSFMNNLTFMKQSNDDHMYNNLHHDGFNNNQNYAHNISSTTHGFNPSAMYTQEQYFPSGFNNASQNHNVQNKSFSYNNSETAYEVESGGSSQYISNSLADSPSLNSSYENSSFSSENSSPYEDPYRNMEADPYSYKQNTARNLHSHNNFYRESAAGQNYPPPGFVGDVYNNNNGNNYQHNQGERAGGMPFERSKTGSNGRGMMHNNNNSYASNDRYNSIGANLQNIEWKNEKMTEIRKDFYIEHPNVANRDDKEVNEILKQYDITIQGSPPIPKPVTTFEEVCFPDYIYNEIKNAKYENPSAIQSVGWPIGLKGRDMIGIAQTGSGKTLAFLLPAMLHINAQPPLYSGDGPIVLILAPTRELAVQIQKEAIKFGRSSKIRNTCVYGGVSRYSQANDLRNGKEIVIATPGRLLDFLESGVTNLKRVTYLVLDEADRMLDMGFEHQIRKICSQIRPDRQTLLYSATWPKEVQILAKEFCKEAPVKIQVGKSELQANSNIKQIVEVVPQIDLRNKFFEWMKNSVTNNDKILIFCETKRGCDQLCRELRYQQYAALAIHGDKEQRERDRILADFKTGRCNILTATDVASRGLDIKNISYVVNFDLPKTIEDYVHRIGRTARGGNTGTAVTFFTYDYYTPEKARMARDIANVMQDVGQTPPPDILELAKSAQNSSGGNRRYSTNGSNRRGGSIGGRNW